jgi:hypothetical protein
MKYLINHRKVISVTTLNKNLCGIISNYVNYTQIFLKSILNNNDLKKNCMKLRNNMFLNDIIVLCVKLGYNGFYIDDMNKNAMNIMNWYYKNHEMNEYMKIIKEHHDNKFYFGIKDDKINNNFINILSLGVFETVKI